LLKASWQDYNQVVGRKIVPLKPGQFVYGRKVAARELGLPESTVRDYMNMLESMGNIVILPTNKFSVVTVSQWGLYQSKDDNSDSKRTADGQQMDTNKKYKKDKKVMYGEFVRLTDEEHQKLTERLGQALTTDYIERLNNYIGSKGTKYKSHYHTILSWVRKDEAQKPTHSNHSMEFHLPEESQ
jgi:Asp-tRNA(Asn)/Glu-tRNA(Gln) amidotransferase C subunit